MSRRQYLIYQEIADPITVTPEAITVDKWFQRRDNPVLRNILPAAILAGSFFFFNTVSLQAGAKVPEWHPQQNQPYRKIFMQQTAEHVRIDVISRGFTQAIFM